MKLLLLLWVLLPLVYSVDSQGKTTCSVHFNSTQHYLNVERFTTFSEFQQGVPVRSLVVRLNAMFTPPEQYPELGGVLLSTGIIPGLYEDLSYVLKYNYASNTVELERWHKYEGDSWKVIVYKHPVELEYNHWDQISFSDKLFVVKGIEMDLSKEPALHRMRSGHPPPFFIIGANYTGFIDDVLVWDSETHDVSPCKYNESSTLLLWLPFNECHGNVAADSSPTGACSRLRSSDRGHHRHGHRGGRHHEGRHHGGHMRPTEGHEEKLLPMPFWLKNADLGDTRINIWERFHHDCNNQPSGTDGWKPQGPPLGPIPLETQEETQEVVGQNTVEEEGKEWLPKGAWKKHGANVPISWGYSVLFKNEYCRYPESKVDLQCPYYKEDKTIGGNDGHEHAPTQEPSNGGNDNEPNQGSSNEGSAGSNQSVQIIGDDTYGDKIFWLFIFQFIFTGCMCCCYVRRKQRNAASQAYQPVPQVDAETQVGPNIHYDYEDYEANIGYPGSYIPDIMQMRSADGSDSPVEMLPPMIYTMPGQPSMGYPHFMMPNIYYAPPNMPQFHPWQTPVYSDVEVTQFVPEPQQNEERDNELLL